MGLKTSLRTVLDGFGSKGRLVFHALFWRSGREPASLMWSWSDLMTITVARFGSAALSRELLPIPCLVQKMFPIMFLLPLSFSRQIIRYRPSGGTTGRTSWLMHGSSVCPSPFFFRSCLFIPLSVSHPLPTPFGLYSDVKVKRWTGFRALPANCSA